ncbi:uncharacterized protein LOC111080335 [Drosophila obscura]|uniref:uncharacterized protein LOC111080335 n=1 Tax=Drosophila obscura TaxID=7282 RepID=UPI001BB20B2C|nr:uncharacterized protein LOC111080335 [Drosophila obscura]
MLQLSVDRGLALLLLMMLLGLFASLDAAPSPSTRESKKSRRQELVRVYSINQKQYDRVLQLTQGKNVISEARLINGGFATVSDSLSSGWHSLLRIVGLTTLSKANEETKVDFDGQPLCVIKTREDAPREEGSARSSATDTQDEEEAINCIVVLKKEPDLELPTQYQSQQYWYPQSAVVPSGEEAAVKEQAEEVEEQAEEVEEQTEVEVTSETPQRSRSKSKKHNISSESTADSSEDHSDLPRQYGAGYPPPPPPRNTEPIHLMVVIHTAPCSLMVHSPIPPMDSRCLPFRHSSPLVRSNPSVRSHPLVNHNHSVGRRQSEVLTTPSHTMVNPRPILMVPTPTSNSPKPQMRRRRPMMIRTKTRTPMRRKMKIYTAMIKNL